MNRRRDHYAELLELIGERGIIALAERFGGTRLLIPTAMRDDHVIAQVVGFDLAARLSERLAPDVINVPLARELRAAYYCHVLQHSHAQIASRLGMTEGGVLRLLKRTQPKREQAESQLPLFPTD